MSSNTGSAHDPAGQKLSDRLLDQDVVHSVTAIQTEHWGLGYRVDLHDATPCIPATVTVLLADTPFTILESYHDDADSVTDGVTLYLYPRTRLRDEDSV